MKKCTSCILIFSLCLGLLAGCGGDKRVDQEYLLSGEYFKDQTVLEHAEYLANMFYTALPHTYDYRNYGLSNLSTYFGSDLENNRNYHEYDRVYLSYANNYYFASKIPVFYGLLKETAVFEEKMGIDTTKLAKKHGTKYAVRAEEVEDFCTMIFRRTDVQVQHQSTSGAEYIEEDNVYVYDELVNPFQQFYDNGWELDFLSFFPVEEDDEWGGDYLTIGESYTPLWYAKDGTVYDMYGDEYFKQQDPSNRFDSENNFLTDYMYQNGYIEYRTYFRRGWVGIVFDESGYVSGKMTTDVPITDICVGMGVMQYG